MGPARFWTLSLPNPHSEQQGRFIGLLCRHAHTHQPSDTTTFSRGGLLTPRKCVAAGDETEVGRPHTGAEVLASRTASRTEQQTYRNRDTADSIKT